MNNIISSPEQGAKKPARRTVSAIQGRLFLLLLIVLIPLLLVQAGIYYSRFQEERADAFESNLEMARGAAKVFDEFVRDVLRQELAIGMAFTLSQPLSALDMQRILDKSKVEYPILWHISWVSPQGEAIASSYSRAAGVNVSDRPYFREIVAGKEWTVSDLVTSKTMGRPVFTINRGIRDESGRLLGAVVAVVVPEELDGILLITRVGEGTITLMDRQGRMAYRYPRSKESSIGTNVSKRYPNVEKILQGEEVTFGYRGISDEKRKLYAFTPVKSIGWSMGVSRPEEEVIAPVISSLIHNAGLYLLVAIGSFLAALFISRTIAVPVQALTEHAELLGRGEDAPPMKIHGPAELRELGHVFHRMAEEIRFREEWLERERERAQGLAEEAERRAAETEESKRILEAAQNALRQAHDELEARVQERTAELVKLNEVLQAEIAERKRAQMALENERQRLFSLLDNLPAFVFLMAPDYSIRFANGYFKEHFGEIEGRSCYNVLTERQEPCVNCTGLQILSSRSALMREWTHSSSGKTFQVHGYPFTDIDGSPLVLELGIDITGRKRAEDDLKVYAEKLELRNRELQDFAFVASHDLQEPLRKVQSFGDRLKTKHGECLNEEARDYLERMQNAARRMQTLIQALLAYSRVTTKAEPFIGVNLNTLMKEVLEDLETAVEDTGGSVEIGDLPVIEADASQMRQLFQNLISNALKFHGAEKPRIRVYAEPAIEMRLRLKSKDRMWYRIIVEDNGIGFDEKYKERIFIPFQRLHGYGKYEGTGMGLAICRKIVERHGGNIMVKSAPGEGSAFTIVLPSKQPKGGYQHEEL